MSRGIAPSLLIALALGGAARRASAASIPPIAIERAEGCFDANALAEALRRRLPEATVRVGAASDPAAAIVTINREGEAIVVRVTRRAEGGAERSERREIPASGACAVQLETAASIVARAVAPLGSPLAIPLGPIEVPRAKPAFRVLVGPVTVGPLPERPPPWLQAGAAFRFAVALDGSPLSSPGLLLTAGVRLRHFLVLVGGGVEGLESRAAGQGTIAVRRAPLRAGAAYEIDLPRGLLRLGLGGLLELWTADVTEPTEGGTLLGHQVLARPGIYAEAGYHLRFVRAVEAFAAIDFETTFAGEGMAIEGLGTVVTTPAFWLCPRVGVAFNFF